MSDCTSRAFGHPAGVMWTVLCGGGACRARVMALAVAGSLVEELRRKVAVGNVAITPQGCLALPAHMCPKGLGKMALCVVLLCALWVDGGGKHVAAGRSCAMGMILGVFLASHTAVWGAVALAVDCLWLACAAASQA